MLVFNCCYLRAKRYWISCKSFYCKVNVFYWKKPFRR